MSGERVLLETAVTDGIIIKTSQFEPGNYITYYEVKGGRVASLQRYTSELDAREGHLKWILKAWYKKSPQELICET